MRVILLLIILCFNPFMGKCFAQSSFEEAEELLQKGEIEKAKIYFRDHQQVQKSMEYLGDIACFQKNWDEAIEYYKILVEDFPDNAMYNFKLGGALGMKAYYGSKFQAALLVGDIKKYLKKAAQLDPAHKESRRALVEFYMQLPEIIGGSKTIAESYASELNRINQIDGLLADAYIYKIQDYDALAKNKYSEAIRLALKKPNLISRNYLYYELGEAAAKNEIFLDEGKEFLTNYIKHYGYKDIKSPAWAYLNLARIERLQKNKATALKHIEESLTIDNDFEKARVEKQRILRM